jgi:hypothetical protein
MGIGPQVAEIIIREHLFKPLPQRLVTIGRPYVALGLEQALAIFARCGCEPKSTTITFDDYSIESRQRTEADGLSISDKTFFGMLGVDEVVAVDISDYEGAEIITDLNRPIPEELIGTAECIFGSSTLDNVFDPAQYLRNISAMLTTNGRLIEADVWANRYRPYVLVSPAWLFDYFVVNRFQRCRLFMIEYSNGSHLYELRVWHNPKQQVTWGLIDNFEIDQNVPVTEVVIAERSRDSSWHVSPVQDVYRSQDQLDRYNENLMRILENQHPVIHLPDRGVRPLGLQGAGPGHNYGWIGTFAEPPAG